jgi:transposase
MRVVGLDAHPYMFSAAGLAGLDALRANIEWEVDRIPLERMEEILVKRTAPGDIIALEASGNSFSIVERLAKCGRTAIILESQAVGKVSKSHCTTDKTSAVKIARIYLSGLAHIVWKPDETTMARRELFFAHRNAVRDSVRARNRIWAWFNGNGMRRPKGLRLAKSDAMDKILALKPWSPMQATIIESLVTTFQEAETRRMKFNSMIAEEVTADPEVLKLVRLLGVKHLVAFALAAFIGSIDRFATPKKLAAYFGLNPSVHRSGKGGGNGALANCGRSDVRSMLIQAAQSVMRYGQGDAHRWAIALKMRKGTCLAVAALARKLAVAVWYLMKGFFSPMTEISNSVRVKIHKIACAIRLQRIKKLGYTSVRSFEEEKLKLLMAT